MGLPFPSPGDLPNPGIKLKSPELHSDSLPSKPPGKPNPPWAVPNPPGQPQEQTFVDNSHAEVEIKPQLKPRDRVLWKEEDQNLPTIYKSCRLNSHDQLGRLCVYRIYKRAIRYPSKKIHLIWQLWTLEATTHRGRTRLKSELPPHQVWRPAQY